MAYLHPGVYVEEIPSGSKPIEGVGTSTASFVGYTTKGPIGEPNLISKWDDYDKEYGGVRNLNKDKEGDPMGLSVSAFFQNGGTKAYIVRITDSHAEKAVGYVDNPADSATGNSLRFTAVNEGAWANGLIVKMSGSLIDSNLYDVEIGRNNDKGVFSSLERFTDVSLDVDDPVFIKNVIDGVSELVTVDLVMVDGTTSMTSDRFLGSSRSGVLSGVSLDFSGLTAANRKLKLTIDGGAENPITLAAENYSSLSAVAGAIESKVRALAASDADECYTGFTCVVEQNRLLLTSGTRKVTSAVVVNHGAGIASTLKLGVITVPFTGSSSSDDLSDFIGIDLTSEADANLRSLSGKIDGTDFGPYDFGQANFADLNAIRDKINDVSTGLAGVTCTVVDNRLVLSSDLDAATSSVIITSDFGLAPGLKLGVYPTNHGGSEITGQQYYDANLRIEQTGQQSADVTLPQDALDGGMDGGQPTEDDYDDVFTKFIKYRDINIICLPGQKWSTDSSGNPVIQKAIGHAEKMKNRMVIIDPPPSYELDNAKKVIDMELPSQTYCVLYYPWVEAANRFYHAERFPGLPKNVLVPPSGYAAGMWAKIDARRGVWKAPAGMGTGLLGVSKLEHIVEDDEQDSLNPLGINCLRSMPGAGKVIWGARTRATRADPEWRYVPVRRTAIMIEQSIYNGIQWAVFEPNDHRLWSALRGNIGGFMNSLFRVGAFQGEKASDAYFVRCGLGDTMTQAEIDAGQVIVIVGFAPLKPAEFVIVRIQQKVNQQ